MHCNQRFEPKKNWVFGLDLDGKPKPKSKSKNPKNPNPNPNPNPKIHFFLDFKKSKFEENDFF